MELLELLNTIITVASIIWTITGIFAFIFFIIVADLRSHDKRLNIIFNKIVYIIYVVLGLTCLTAITAWIITIWAV
jgi:hypothetical protein